MLENLFGELANDLSIKSLIQRLSKFSFDPSGQLRVGGSVGVSGSLTTVTTVTVDSLWIQKLPNGNLTMWLKGV